MKAWFDSLEQRERVTLVIGAIALALALLWILLIDPLYSSASQRHERLSALRSDLVHATRLNAEIAALGRVPGSGAAEGRDQSLLIVAERSARAAGLQVDGARPTDDSTVRVRFESASFDALVRWMAALSSRYGVRVDIASIDRNDTPGTVDAQITIKRPAA